MWDKAERAAPPNSVARLQTDVKAGIDKRHATSLLSLHRLFANLPFVTGFTPPHSQYLSSLKYLHDKPTVDAEQTHGPSALRNHK